MARQFRITAVTPPANPELGGEAQLFLDLDTRGRVMTTPTIQQTTRFSVNASGGGRSRVNRLGRDPVKISFGVRIYVPDWVEAATPALLLSEDRHFLYPLNVWYDNGNRVRFVANGYGKIPDGEYEIMNIRERWTRTLDGAPWFVEYQLDFQGGE